MYLKRCIQDSFANLLGFGRDRLEILFWCCFEKAAFFLKTHDPDPTDSLVPKQTRNEVYYAITEETLVHFVSFVFQLYRHLINT